MTKNYIDTRTGYFDYDDMNKSVFNIEDIAHALENICRFTGHVDYFYSVCQHSLLVSELAKRDGHDKEVQLYCLLHDAHEAFMNDVSTPLKRYMLKRYGFDVNEISEEIDIVVFNKLGMMIPDTKMKDIIKYYDLKALYNERVNLFESEFDWDGDWEKYFVKYEDIKEYFDNTLNWKELFLQKYFELTS